jgi:hypothetical protein
LYASASANAQRIAATDLCRYWVEVLGFRT